MHIYGVNLSHVGVPCDVRIPQKSQEQILDFILESA